jgi:hypothetical protein
MYRQPTIACILLAHAYPEVVKDTLESIFCHVTNKVIVLVDGLGWENFKDLDLSPAKVIKGFNHGKPRSPYRNSVLGVKLLYEQFPDVEWYCYMEYDTVFASESFKEDLKCDAWVVGTQMRIQDFHATLLSDILGKKIKKQYKLLGACMFLNREFVKNIVEIGFIDRFIKETEGFKKGWFPQKRTYAFEEILWPTIAVSLGGKIKEIVSFGKEYRNYSNWVVRYRRKLRVDLYKKLRPSIIHPLKKFDEEVRTLIRSERHQKIGMHFN